MRHITLKSRLWRPSREQWETMDRMSASTRSKIMSSIRSKNTKPEMTVRRRVYALGYRYRIHVKYLPGTPDLVFFGRRKIILVHGCYWHRHANCKLAGTPSSNVRYWEEKFQRNIARDAMVTWQLEQLGWGVLVIWECELKDADVLTSILSGFLGPATRC